MLYGILNIVFGALVLSPALISKEKRQKYASVLSWVGIILLIWGIMGVVTALLYIAALATAPLYWILWIAGGTTCLLLGIILSVGLLKKSAAGVANKVLPYQTIIAIVAIIIGVLQLFVKM